MANWVMKQNFLQNGVLKRFAEFWIIMAINGISGRRDLAIRKSREELAALLSEPLGQMSAETALGTAMASQEDNGWDAGGLAAREEHRGAEMIEGEPGTGIPALEMLDKGDHVTG